ncbi:MAG TPA: right-handed parallel beta-helix repeat-containing protein, partial [Synergistaceae bacterium]|nr:right-handed parallel beta-helix repeat-containing protein [Synergistaceae bacterium]
MLCSDGVKKKGVVFPSILFLFFLAVCFVISPSAEGAFFVTPEGAGNEDGSSWEHAYGEKDLQTAVDAAAVGGGGEVWVAAGVYRPSLEGDQNVPFTLKTGVALYGGFSGTEIHRSERDWEENLTVLTGDLDNNDEGKVYGVTVSADQIVGDNSKTVVKAGNTDDTAILDGFTVCGGSNALGQGGGMHNGSGSPRVINCTFIGNATRKGGGVYNDSGSPEIANCTFTGNAASWRGGGMCNWSGSARVINCTFTDNDVDLYGGGMYNDSGSP